MVEASPVLKAIQKRRSRSAARRCRGPTQFDAARNDRALFLLANEFFDALPIRQFVNTERGWCERMVTADAEGALHFALSPVPADAMVAPDRHGAPMGGVYELSPAATALVEEIAHSVARHGGGGADRRLRL